VEELDEKANAEHHNGSTSEGSNGGDASKGMFTGIDEETARKNE
jgi:hypothetical protein